MSDNNKKKGAGRPSTGGLFSKKKPEQNAAQKPNLEEELVQSPGRTALRNFFAKKLAILGLIMFCFVFLGCFVLSAVFPLDINFQDSTQQHIAPGFDFMKVPKALEGNIKQISVGSFFSVGIDQSGKLYQWGKLTTKLKRVPANMGNLVSVSAGLDHALALNDRGEIFTWGNDRLMLSPIPMEVRDATITKIFAGNQISVAVDDKGEVFIWGNTNFIDINLSLFEGTPEKIVLNSSTAYIITTDKRIVGLTNKDITLAKVPTGIDGRVVDAASTDKAAAVLLDDGTVLTWGSPDYGARAVPDEIQGRVKALSAGRGHFTALLTDGTVAAWGMNNYKQTNVPAKISGTVMLTSGYFQNYAVDAGGNVTTWGLKGYLMGSDHYGRDLFTRLLEGGKVTLTVGFISVVIAGIIGILVGGISGFYGGKVDTVLMRVGEIVNAIPFLPLAIILSYLIGNRLPQSMRMFMVMIILGVLSWPYLARLTRAQILVERENEFVTAAKAMGIKEGVIIFKHILPNVIAVVLVNLTLSLASSMLTESSLSFLGFGILEPYPSWGNMLSNMGSDVIRNYAWRWVFPCLALGLATISINLIGDAFRDAIDPKSNDR